MNNEHIIIIKSFIKKMQEDILEKDEASFLIEQLILYTKELNLIKEVFAYCGKKNIDIINNSNIYKWAFTIAHQELYEFLEENMKIKNIDGAVKASISHNNYIGLYYLSEKYDIMKEQYFSYAIGWSEKAYRYQEESRLILDLFIRNLEKIQDISEFSIQTAKNLGGQQLNYTLEQFQLTQKLKKNLVTNKNNRSLGKI